MTAEEQSGWRLIKWAWENKKEIAKRARELLDWLRGDGDREPGMVLVLGAGGVRRFILQLLPTWKELAQYASQTMTHVVAIDSTDSASS